MRFPEVHTPAFLRRGSRRLIDGNTSPGTIEYNPKSGAIRDGGSRVTKTRMRPMTSSCQRAFRARVTRPTEGAWFRSSAADEADPIDGALSKIWPSGRHAAAAAANMGRMKSKYQGGSRSTRPASSATIISAPQTRTSSGFRAALLRATIEPVIALSSPTKVVLRLTPVLMASAASEGVPSSSTRSSPPVRDCARASSPSAAAAVKRHSKSRGCGGNRESRRSGLGMHAVWASCLSLRAIAALMRRDRCRRCTEFSAVVGNTPGKFDSSSPKVLLPLLGPRSPRHRLVPRSFFERGSRQYSWAGGERHAGDVELSKLGIETAFNLAVPSSNSLLLYLKGLMPDGIELRTNRPEFADF